MDASGSQDHLARLSRVYSSDTWSLYERLDKSLEPRGPDWLLNRAGEYLAPGDRILDAGCRDAAHLIQLALTYGLTGVGVEPVAVHVERARAAVAGAGLDSRLSIVQGVLEDLDFREKYFDFIWCRDVIEQVASLEAFLGKAAWVLKQGGRMLVFTVITTDLLTQADRTMLGQHMGNIGPNLSEPSLLAGFEAAELRVEERDVVGTEWREYAEERTQPVSRALLRLARLRRQRETVAREYGEDLYRHVEANLHWELFQMLGKLLPIVYVLQRRQLRSFDRR